MGKDSKSAIWELAKPFLSAAIGAVVATAGLAWQARGMFDEHERRISVIDARQQFDEQHVGDAINQMREDLREVRTAVSDSRSRSGGA